MTVDPGPDPDPLDAASTGDLGLRLLALVRDVLQPIAALSTAERVDEALRELGWNPAAIAMSQPLADAVQALTQTLAPFESAIDLQRPPAFLDVAATLPGTGARIGELADLLTSWVPPAGAPAETKDVLIQDLLNGLPVNALTARFPLSVLVLALVGAVRDQSVAGISLPDGSVLRQAGTRPHPDLAPLAQALHDPLGALHANLASDAAGVRRAAPAILDAVAGLVADPLMAAGASVRYPLRPQDVPAGLTGLASPDHLLAITLAFTDTTSMPAKLRLVLGLTDDTGGQGLGMLIAAEGTLSVSKTTVAGSLTALLTAGAQPLLLTGHGIRLAGAGAGAAPTVGLSLAYASGGALPLVRLGAADGIRFEIDQIKVDLGAHFDAGPPDFSVSVGATGMRLVVQAPQDDGFLAAMLGTQPIESAFDLGLDWSLRGGLHIRGGAGLALERQVGKSVGPLTVDTVWLALNVGLAGTPALTTELALSLSFALGPFAATVQRMGVAAMITFPPRPGNLGPAQVALRLKPPTGVGLALQAPPVSGVGFLAFDEVNGRYLGAIALAVGDVAISAVGVLDTRLPGGASGYSLIVVASAQFPPVQLGFGFSLSGIGGLVGVNRTADVPSLQALARAGRLDDLMFPADLIHRAPQVAANLARQFPVAQGHFIVGPSVQIQWGTGGMIYADIGVFIELSDSGGGITVLRIALLGLVHLTLPAGATPVADITLDVLGVLDFAAKTLSLDAGLRNSTIATFPLTGQAALRAAWGSSPEFLFAIGGFNPHFAAPAGFPALQRIALSIGGDNPRLTLSAYLALTSNTLQLGCTADLYASASVAGVTAAVAASLTFDALVQFKPFGLIVDLTIAASILVNNNPILTLGLDLHVTGPDPWTVTGSASFQFLFWHITVPISITVGPAPPPQPPQLVDLDGNLTTALADPRSWATGPPPGRGLVRVRSQDAAHPAVHPLGSLTVRQHAVPLGQRIERYGPDLLDAACRYDITGTALGTQPVDKRAVTDFFAPAQFLTMTDADKLSAPSFETMTAGATVGSTLLAVPAAPGSAQAPATVVDTWSTATWDTLMLDSPDPSQPPATGTPPAVVPTSGTATVPDALLAAQLPGAAAAINGAAGAGQAIYTATGSGIAVEQPSYAVVGLNLAAPGSAKTITILRIGTVAAGQTAAALGGYGTDCQVVYTSEVPS